MIDPQMRDDLNEIGSIRAPCGCMKGKESEEQDIKSFFRESGPKLYMYISS